MYYTTICCDYEVLYNCWAYYTHARERYNLRQPGATPPFFRYPLYHTKAVR